MIRALMRRTCLIHQQQGIGDLIFIQKIVRKYAENGFNVICPIKSEHRAIRDHFSTEEIHYPLISEQDKLLERFPFDEQHVRLVSECETNFDDDRFAAPFDAGDFIFLALGPAYRRQPEGLMLSKYRLVGMDYSDWPSYVQTKRNYAAETGLWEHLGLKRNSRYTMINEFSSNGRLEIPAPEGDVVYMRKIEGYSLFDWIVVLERCSRLITVDTSLVWLAEVYMKKSVPVHLLSKWPTGQPSYGDFVTALRLPWKWTQRVEDLKLD
jgi:hypothetical protein